jgi:hypothetical protein
MDIIEKTLEIQKQRFIAVSTETILNHRIALLYTDPFHLCFLSRANEFLDREVFTTPNQAWTGFKERCNKEGIDAMETKLIEYSISKYYSLPAEFRECRDYIMNELKTWKIILGGLR